MDIDEELHPEAKSADWVRGQLERRLRENADRPPSPPSWRIEEPYKPTASDVGSELLEQAKKKARKNDLLPVDVYDAAIRQLTKERDRERKFLCEHQLEAANRKQYNAALREKQHQALCSLRDQVIALCEQKGVPFTQHLPAGFSDICKHEDAKKFLTDKINELENNVTHQKKVQKKVVTDDIYNLILAELIAEVVHGGPGPADRMYYAGKGPDGKKTYTTEPVREGRRERGGEYIKPYVEYVSLNDDYAPLHHGTPELADVIDRFNQLVVEKGEDATVQLDPELPDGNYYEPLFCERTSMAALRKMTESDETEHLDPEWLRAHVKLLERIGSTEAYKAEKEAEQKAREEASKKAAAAIAAKARAAAEAQARAEKAEADAKEKAYWATYEAAFKKDVDATFVETQTIAEAKWNGGNFPKASHLEKKINDVIKPRKMELNEEIKNHDPQTLNTVGKQLNKYLKWRFPQGSQERSGTTEWRCLALKGN
jgi:predicted Rdx family selenoprotein